MWLRRCEKTGLIAAVFLGMVCVAFHGRARGGGPASSSVPRPVLDGNLSDLKALVALVETGDLRVGAVDQLDCIGAAADPGADGFQDEPLQDGATPQGRFMHTPINLGNLVLVYVPDSDGLIEPPTQDDSWLAVGVNIANGDGDVFSNEVKLLTPPDLPANVMVPFDADGNGDPCLLGTGANSRWFPNQPVLTFDESSEAISLFFQLCAEVTQDLLGAPDFEILYQQRFAQGTQLVLHGLDPASVSVFPPVGSTCEEIRTRGLDGVLDFPDGLGNDDVEILIDRIDSQVHAMFPGESYREATRFRLARLGVAARSDGPADLSNEDSMVAFVRLPLPKLEAKVEVRRHGAQEYSGYAEAAHWHELDYRIEVENTGDVPLNITLTTATSADELIVAPIEASLHATLFVSSDDEGTPITPENAESFGLNPIFFAAGPAGFLAGCVTGEPRVLGVLSPAGVCAAGVPQEGSRIVLEYRADLGDAWPTCEPWVDELLFAGNSLVAMGSGIGSHVTLQLYDNPGLRDTEREIVQGYDDNHTTVTVACPVAAMTSSIRQLPDGEPYAEEAALQLDVSSFPLQVEIRYVLRNTQEWEWLISLSNLALCDDLELVPGVATVPGMCELCQQTYSPGWMDRYLVGFDSTEIRCAVQFDDATSLQAFLARDDHRADCSATEAPPCDGPGRCYRSCAEARAWFDDGEVVAMGEWYLSDESRLSLCACGDPPPAACPVGNVVFLDPPDGVVDARQPTLIDDATTLLGMQTFVVAAPAGAGSHCWTFCSGPGSEPPINIQSISADSMGTIYTISLDRALSPGSVGRLTYADDLGHFTRGVFTSHPGNVDGNAIASGYFDLHRLIACARGIQVETYCPWGPYSLDIDHSGAFTPADILREIDLLYGAAAFDPWRETPRPQLNFCPP